MIGRGGPFDGTIRALEQPLITVGRVEGNDLVLDDPSISRKHAQIRMAPDLQSFTVVDLRSSNGCFVDGQRIKRAECRVGAIIRFGDLPFKVAQKQARPAKQHRGSSKRRILSAFFLMVAISLGVGTWAYINRPKPKPKPQVSGDQKLREIQAAVQRLVDEGRRRIAMKEWSKAIQVLDQAQKKDPLNKDCKRLRQGALDELSNESTYDKGLGFFNLGNRENLIKAKEVFLTLPKKSIYFRDVRYKLSTINQRLAVDFRIEGVSRCKARFWRQCQVALCKFFDLIPEDAVVPGESNLRRMLKRAEKRLAHRRNFKGCQSTRFIEGGKSAQPGEDPTHLLAEKYDLQPLRGVIMLYYEGKIDLALKRLNVLIKKRAMRPHLVELREVDRQLLIIRGKYQEGYTAIRDRNVTQAHEDWTQVLNADQALMPRKLESFFRREVTRYLGDLYFKLGNEQYKAGRYIAAYTKWTKGKDADARNEKILNGLLSLEQDAERLLRKGKKLWAEKEVHDARRQLNIAKAIVPEGHTIKKEAAKILKDLGPATR